MERSNHDDYDNPAARGGRRAVCEVKVKVDDKYDDKITSAAQVGARGSTPEEEEEEELPPPLPTMTTTTTAGDGTKIWCSFVRTRSSAGIAMYPPDPRGGRGSQSGRWSNAFTTAYTSGAGRPR